MLGKDICCRRFFVTSFEEFLERVVEFLLAEVSADNHPVGVN